MAFARSFIILLLIGFSGVAARRMVPKGRAQQEGADAYDCLTKEVWSATKTAWCCTHKNLGCPQQEGSSFVAVEGQMQLVFGMEAQAGHVLGHRFVLERFVESRSSTKQPGTSFPNPPGFSDPEHLGQGNFGDVWEAYDQKLGKRVAVKIFYSQKSGRKQWLTWNSANTKEKKEMKENIAECELVQNLLKQSSIYPEGASRICQCYEEHVSKYENTNEVVFLVLELCGRSLSKIRDDLKTESGGSTATARHLTKQLLEAVAFMTMADPPLIHHDMKLDNAVALGGADDYQVKVIDFGCYVWGKPENQNSQAIGDRRYMPPEFSQYAAFKLPAYSFDVYGVGLMHMELACPSLTTRDWYSMMWGGAPSWSTLQSAMKRRCPRLPTADIELVQALTNRDYRQRPDPMVARKYQLFGDQAVEPTPNPTPWTPTPAPTPAPTQAPTSSPGPVSCPAAAMSSTPDSYGDCACRSNAFCSRSGGRFRDCPYSGGVGSRTGRRFRATCTDCVCYLAWR